MGDLLLGAQVVANSLHTWLGLGAASGGGGGAYVARAKMIVEPASAASHTSQIVCDPLSFLRTADFKAAGSVLLRDACESHVKAYGTGVTSFVTLFGLIAASVHSQLAAGADGDHLRQSVEYGLLVVCGDVLRDVTRSFHTLATGPTTGAPAASAAATLTANSSAAAAIANIKSALTTTIVAADSAADDEFDWFFDRSGKPPAAPAPKAAAPTSTAAAAKPQPAAMMSDDDRLVALGDALAHGHVSAMRTAIAVARIIRSAPPTATQQPWELSAVRVSSFLGGSAAGGEDSVRVLRGVLLDVNDIDRRTAQRVVASPQPAPASNASSTNISASRACRVVIVNGDISMPAPPTLTLSASPSQSDVRSALTATADGGAAYVKWVVSAVRAHGISLILIRDSIHPSIRQALTSAHVLPVTGVSYSEMGRVAALSGAATISEFTAASIPPPSTGAASAAFVGRCGLELYDSGWNDELHRKHLTSHESKFADSAASKCCILVTPPPPPPPPAERKSAATGTASDPGGYAHAFAVANERDGTTSASATPLGSFVPITVLIRHSTATANSRYEAEFWTCLKRLRNVYSDSGMRVVPGGGTTELLCALALEQAATQSAASGGSKSTGRASVLRALAGVFREWIAIALTNCGITTATDASKLTATCERELLLPSGVGTDRRFAIASPLARVALFDAGDDPAAPAPSPLVCDEFSAKFAAFERCAGLLQLMLSADSIVSTRHNRTPGLPPGFRGGGSSAATTSTKTLITALTHSGSRAVAFTF